VEEMKNTKKVEEQNKNLYYFGYLGILFYPPQADDNTV